MAVLRISRFTAEPGDADELLARRAALIASVRASYPGLTEARLTRLDDRTWVDLWRWESAEHVKAALAGAPSLAEAGPAFALTQEMTAEQLTIVDEC
jgi:heme-degrading monooxygenase HmoA